MERSEPALAPEWLKSSNGLNHHSNSGDRCTRSRNSYSNSSYDSPRSVFTDSPFFDRKSSSNGSLTHRKNGYSGSYSFGRNRRDKDWDTDIFDIGGKKERWFLGDRRDRYSASFGVSVNKDRILNNTLRRTQSMVSEKLGEPLARKTETGLKVSSNGDCGDAWGSMAGRVQKGVVERDLPSRGLEERLGTPDVVRVPSPSLSISAQGSPYGASVVCEHGGWTSALAEAPVVTGTNNRIPSSVQQPSPARLSTIASTTKNGLSMAETLAQAPSRPRSAPQISVETQRLEELAIKQSRQLVPVTSLVPKNLVSSDKPKLKSAARGEMNTTSKSGYQQLSSQHLGNNSSRGGPAKLDMARSCHVGGLLVLRPAQVRYGISSTDKDRSANSGGVDYSLSVDAPPSTIGPLRITTNEKSTAIEHKASSHPAIYAPTMEKRSTVSCIKSRNYFFEQLRKGSSGNLSSAITDQNYVLSTVSESSADLTVDVSMSVSSQTDVSPLSEPSCDDRLTGNGAKMASNTVDFKESQTYPNIAENCAAPAEAFPPDEEERALLYLLGWEENAGGEDGLTEEEIRAFKEMCMQVKPSLVRNW